MEPKAGSQGDNEIDNNADTCCLGKNYIILNYTNRSADVYAYDTSYKPIEDVPIVSGATAIDDPNTGMTYILVFNEALYYGDKLDHSLINPNQIRSYGIDLWDNPYDTDRDLSIVVNDELKIQMTTIGTKVLFGSRAPNEDELKTCQHITLTSPFPWNPKLVK